MFSVLAPRGHWRFFWGKRLNTIEFGDCRETMRRWAADGVKAQMCVTTRPYKGAHFATFPTALIEPCILAGSRPGDIVLDPFMGSDTTAAVALQHGRQYLGCELNPEYGPLQAERIGQAAPVIDLFSIALSGAEIDPKEAL